MRITKRMEKAMRPGIKTILVAALAFAGGCDGTTESTLQKTELVRGLQVQTVYLQNVADELEAPGSVIAVSTAQVAARTMGTVLQVAVREGDTVKRGQVLAQLDERELSAHRSASGIAGRKRRSGAGDQGGGCGTSTGRCHEENL